MGIQGIYKLFKLTEHLCQIMLLVKINSKGFRIHKILTSEVQQRSEEMGGSPNFLLNPHSLQNIKSYTHFILNSNKILKKKIYLFLHSIFWLLISNQAMINNNANIE